MSHAADHPHFDSVEDGIRAIAEGRLVIVTDDEDRENEGDLVMAASKATVESVNMMIRHARGLICVPTTGHHLKRLGIEPMVRENRESLRTAFTVSVDAASGITTGISAYDRTRTIQLLVHPETRPDELVRPGHIFPLQARDGGVLERAGHTEAAVDLVSLAGLQPTAVICEILNEDGSCSRLPQLIEFKRRHGLTLLSIAQLIEYRHRREPLVERVAQRPFDSEFGRFELHVFRSKLDGRVHLAFTLGQCGPEPTLVRVQSENILSDVFRGIGLTGYQSITGALSQIAAAGHGVLLYMQHTSTSDDATRLGTLTQPTPMGLRDYGLGAQILVSLGLRKVRLLTRTPSRHVVGLEGYGLEIVEHLAV